MINIWESIAYKWRVVEEETGSGISIEKITDDLLEVIQEGKLFTTAYEYLDTEEDEDSEDDDWP